MQKINHKGIMQEPIGKNDELAFSSQGFMHRIRQGLINRQTQGWTLDASFDEAAESLEVSRYVIMHAWLFGERYGNPTI